MPAARSELAALAQRLAALAPALAAAIEAAPHWDSPALWQAEAAITATSACAMVANQLQLKGSDALRVAAAAKVLVLAGRAALVAVTGAVRQTPTAVPGRQSVFESLLAELLSGMAGCMALVGDCGRPDAIAVFAATAAAPGALLPWLATASVAMLLACRTSQQGAAGLAACSRAADRQCVSLHCAFHSTPIAESLLSQCCRRGRPIST